jgi:hypothetical protein
MALLMDLPGRMLWIACWYGILAIGVVGLAGALLWGPGLRWRNLDEILRGIGTIAVSAGMLLVLYGASAWLGQALLTVALGVFAMAFVVGDRGRRRNRPPLRLPAEPPARPARPSMLAVAPSRRPRDWQGR